MKTLGIACGGTGGHFYPGLSIAREFKARGGAAVLFIGGHHREEQLELARTHGVRAVPAPAVRLPGGPLGWLLFPWRMLFCIWKSMRLLRREKITVALGMGGYASVALGLAAVRLRIPLALHEGNASLGQANRLLSRWAKLLGLSFPLGSDTGLSVRREIVGMPIREEILQAAARGADEAGKAELCRELGLDPSRPIVFIFGGSQGARAVNAAVEKLLPILSDEQKILQFIHFTGRDDNAELEAAYRKAGLAAAVKARDPEIHRFYQASDFIICRAGASTIAELAVLGKAPLMIPFPGAKAKHQMANARAVMEAEGGWLLPQKELTPERLRAQLAEWLTTCPKRGDNIKKLAKPSAAADMARLLFELGRDK